MEKKLKLSRFACLVAVIGALFLTYGADIAAAESRPADEAITLWVKDALLEDSLVPVASINVSTDDGIVKLTGTVRSLAAKEYADMEAKKIKGVRGVLNDINVNAPFRYDYDIAQDVSQRILNNASIKTHDIDVVVSDGVVTLNGKTSTWAEADQAELLATETRGVKSVINNLEPSYPKKRSDSDIRKDVESALSRDVYLTGLPISVSVDSGTVVLKGEVGTPYQKDRAASDVRWIWNVKQVDNQLDVEPWVNEGSRKKIAVPTDAQLKQAVNEELVQDQRLTDPFAIAVSASSGHVTLSGSVPTMYQKRVAAKDAKNIVGVAWVTNLVQVNDILRSDKAILDDVQFEIDTDYMLDLDYITAKVKDGVVTLTGNVNTFWEKSHAADVASRVAGVRSIINMIKVNYSNVYTDQSIRERIEHRLDTNAETMWVANDIDVTVDRGKVTLTGMVDYWSEYDAAENVAYHTDGVWAVVNRLSVRGYDYDWSKFTYPWPDAYANGFYYPKHMNDHYRW